MEEELEHKVKQEVASIEDALFDAEKQAELAPEKGKVDFFSTFGKIAAVVIVIAILVGGGIFAGTKLQDSGKLPNNNIPEMKEMTEASPTISTSPQITSMPTQTSAAALDKSTTAGGAGGTSFKVYQIDYPSSWTVKHEKTDITDDLTLTKGAYSMTIRQAPSGGNQCVYPGDKKEGMMISEYKKYVEIQGAHDKLRRSWSDEGPTITYSVCQESNSAYGLPTSFGYITIKAPNPADESVMKEIDAMLASLTTK